MGSELQIWHCHFSSLSSAASFVSLHSCSHADGLTLLLQFQSTLVLEDSAGSRSSLPLSQCALLVQSQKAMPAARPAGWGESPRTDFLEAIRASTHGRGGGPGGLTLSRAENEEEACSRSSCSLRTRSSRLVRSRSTGRPAAASISRTALAISCAPNCANKAVRGGARRKDECDLKFRTVGALMFLLLHFLFKQEGVVMTHTRRSGCGCSRVASLDGFRGGGSGSTRSASSAR